VHATLAAGIMYSVSRACREGGVAACGCRRQRGRRGTEPAASRWSSWEVEWQWGGCGDDSEHGYRFTTTFVDARQREKNYPRHSPALKRTLANLHNNEAGRLVYTTLRTTSAKQKILNECSK